MAIWRQLSRFLWTESRNTEKTHKSVLDLKSATNTYVDKGQFVANYKVLSFIKDKTVVLEEWVRASCAGGERRERLRRGENTHPVLTP